jgi:protein-S-isoprenylcysteine O-methyltransferase Ste14
LSLPQNSWLAAIKLLFEGAFMNAAEHSNVSTSQILLAVVYLLSWPIIMLFLAGDWQWIEGWLFGVWFTILGLSCLIYLYRKDPALLAERFRQPGTGNEKGWDRFAIYFVQILYWAWIIIMPLDAKRYGWTPGFPVWVKSLGGIGLLPAFFLLYRSFTDNTFLSPLVRIQSERNHQVVSTGVYGFIRHPMYLGAIFFFIGTPTLLGSKYGLLIGALVSLLLIARIIGEEKMLVEELEGYSDYKTKVKYRLFPLVW